MKPVRKAVFPVAGLGTRFLPATKTVPKEMLPLLDRPLIQYAVDEARAAGIEEFIFVTSPGKTALENYFGAATLLEQSLFEKGKTGQLEALRPSNVVEGSASFVRQDNPRGLGHAVLLARRLVGDEPFAVILPDDVIRSQTPALRQMVDAYPRHGGHMIATEIVPGEKISSYGVVEIDRRVGQVQMLRGLVEKPRLDDAPSQSGVVGRYILAPSIFDRLAVQQPGSGGEIQLTDAIAADLGETAVNGFEFDGERFDCGSVAGFLHATIAFAMDRQELCNGVQEFIGGRLVGAPRAA